MAGLRLGYALISDTALLRRISAASQAWGVSVAAQIAGVAALSCKSWFENSQRVVREGRQYLTEGLAALGMTVFPTDANFILFRCESPLRERLLEKQIMIRSCGNFAGLDDSYYRIGVKKHDENRVLLQTIREVLNG
jgi:threonine-phosphate decarboxylase